MFIAGETLKNAIQKDSQMIYHFDTEQGLSQEEVRH